SGFSDGSGVACKHAHTREFFLALRGRVRIETLRPPGSGRVLRPSKRPLGSFFGAPNPARAGVCLGPHDPLPAARGADSLVATSTEGVGAMKRPSTLYALAAVLWLGPGPVTVVAVAQGLASKDPATLESSAVPVELRTDAGNVEFLATGWPSALKIHGKGTGPSGVLTITDRALSGSLAVDLNSLETGIGLRDRHLKEEYLQVDRFPQARLTFSRLDVACVPESAAFGPVTVPFEGTLLLHGVERPVSGQARVSRHDDRVSVGAQFSIKLGDFGVEIPKYMGITVAEKVDVKTTFSAALEPGRAVARR